MKIKYPCLECGLRYSSYCMGCELKLFGIGALPVPEEKPRRRCKDENENGQTCTFDSKDESLKS